MDLQKSEENTWFFLFLNPTLIPPLTCSDHSPNIQTHREVWRVFPPESQTASLCCLCLLPSDILFTISTHLRVIILGNACLTAPINSKLLLKCMKNTLERLNVCTHTHTQQTYSHSQSLLLNNFHIRRDGGGTQREDQAAHNATKLYFRGKYWHVEPQRGDRLSSHQHLTLYWHAQHARGEQSAGCGGTTDSCTGVFPLC